MKSKYKSKVLILTAQDNKHYTFVLVLEYGERTFDAIIRHQHIAGTELSKSLARGLAQAIAQLHDKNIIHGDIKPLNIVLVQDFTIVKLLDLDVSCTIGSYYGSKAPSTAYCSPEVAREVMQGENALKSLKANVAHDVFAFGLNLYELVTGQAMWKKDKNDNVGDTNVYKTNLQT